MSGELKSDVIVVGGGIAGLVCAYKLMNKGIDVHLLEADQYVGGNVRTISHQGFRLEKGPNTFMGSADSIFNLIDEVGLTDKIIPAANIAKNRYIVRNNKMHAAPMSPWSFATTPLLSFKAKLRLMIEPLFIKRGNDTDSAMQFFTRRFGEEAARVLCGAFISGVYAGDASALSAKAAFPLFWGFEKKYGSMIRGAFHYKKELLERRKRCSAKDSMGRHGLFSISGGLGELTTEIARLLGDRCHTDSAVDSIEKMDDEYILRSKDQVFKASNIVLAVPPNKAYPLVKNIDHDLSKYLESIYLAPVAVVYLSLPSSSDKLPEGYGFLAPRKEGVRILGSLFSSMLFPDRAPAGSTLLTAFVGGVFDPEALSLSDEELFSVVKDDLTKLTSISEGYTPIKVVRHYHAIPQFRLGYSDLMENLASRLNVLPSLSLAGNYLKGVGMKDAVSSGYDAFNRVLKNIT